jgi:hypothetical protein
MIGIKYQFSMLQMTELLHRNQFFIEIEMEMEIQIHSESRVLYSWGNSTEPDMSFLSLARFVPFVFRGLCKEDWSKDILLQANAW